MNRPASESPTTPLERRLDTLREPFREFIRAQTTAGVALVLALGAALLLFNLGGRGDYQALRTLELGIHFGPWRTSLSFLELTNDLLIALFFFLIGLEIKRELLSGELQEPPRRRMLVVAAGGGMAMPALIFSGINLALGGAAASAWGIPMATDTALAIGVLAILGGRLAPGAAAFLVGLAIVDDMGAVAVIALFYTGTLHTPALLAAALLLGLSLLCNYSGLRHPLIYAAIGVAVWAAVHASGVHASIAGVLMAATVPARPRMRPLRLVQRLRRRAASIDPAADVLADPDHHERIASLVGEAQAATTPLRRWEHALDLPVALLILPLFVFLNAGVDLSPGRLAQAAADPLALGIVLGLLLGKPIGIVGAALLAARTGVGRLPPNLGTRDLLGLGLLAGIGFTMSTFIASLALPDQRMETAKLAILAASLVAAVLGYTALRTPRART